jgi:hypothetical protein
MRNKTRLEKLEKTMRQKEDVTYVICPEEINGKKCVSVQKRNEPVVWITLEEFEALGIEPDIELKIDFV